MDYQVKSSCKPRMERYQVLADFVRQHYNYWQSGNHIILESTTFKVFISNIMRYYFFHSSKKREIINLLLTTYVTLYSYLVFGEDQRTRSVKDIAFQVALFIAKKGSYVNYYMVRYSFHRIIIPFLFSPCITPKTVVTTRLLGRNNNYFTNEKKT